MTAGGRARGTVHTRAAVAARLGFSLALLLATGAASAQTQDADAERLFREGQKLMEERRFGEACPKFEAAFAKDRQLGTLINLAFCHKEQGALWYAWLEFRQAEVKAADRPDRRDFARARLAELEKQLPKAVLERPKRVALTEVLVEDRRVWDGERGTPFAVETGQRKFTFRARGKKQVTTLINVTVTKGERPQRVPVPDMLEDADDPPPPVTAPPTTNGENPRAEAPPASDDHPGATQRTAGWVGIGVGGVGLVVGAVFGVKTFTSPCAAGKDCGSDDRSAARTAGTTADIAWIVAGVGIIGGTVLVLTAPGASAKQARLVVTPEIGAGWAGVHGTF